MKRINNIIILLILSLFMFTIFAGCSSKNNTNSTKNTFDVEQFQNEMKAKNYDLKLKDVDKDFLPTARKYAKIGEGSLSVYIFNSNKEMESTAKCIDEDGGGYKDGSKGIQVSWVLPPYFFKRGNIIVQYVGGDEKIISDLGNILGKQFAGR